MLVEQMVDPMVDAKAIHPVVLMVAWKVANLVVGAVV